MAPQHPIFQGPYPVELRYEDVPTPENYRRYFDGVDLPETLPVWHVDTTDYRTADDLKPGTVASGWGFEDSPDAEVIASGINSKGPSNVSLGRHGSLMLWGFAAEPGRMTPSGRNAFLNSIHYIQRFDHAARLVERVGRGREWALQSALKNPDRLTQVRADFEYLRLDGRSFVVDEDCKALGLSNRSIDTLEHCVRGLENSEDTQRCERVLRRYTGEDFSDPAEWRRWLDSSRGSLFFSDVGGCRFFDAARGASSAPSASDAAPGDAPVELAVSVDSATARAGEVIAVTVTVTHEEGWHTYASIARSSAYIATSVELELPDGWSTVGRWHAPLGEPFDEEDGTRIHEGVTRFVLRVRVDDEAESGEEYDLRASVSYLACDENQCLPPETARLEAQVRVR